MDFERLERAWRSPDNTPSAAATAHLLEDAMNALKTRRRTFSLITGMAGFALLLLTGRIAWDMATARFPFDPSREWGALALLGLAWIALVVVRVRAARRLKAHPDPYASMPETLRALIDENREARRRVWVMAGFMVLAVAGLGVSLGQLVEVGKMTPANVRDGVFLFGGVMAAVWGWVAVNYVTRLKPEGERLARLLADYGE